jgi:hypothetical protein
MMRAGAAEVEDMKGVEVMKGKGIRNDVKRKEGSGVVLMCKNQVT